jgi:hypothetical protein
MECKDVEGVLEREGLSPLSVVAREHLADCEGCRELLADLSTIAVAAKRIPAEENPPERIWIALREQLEAEGIIREPQVTGEAVAAASWWQGFAPWLRPRALAMVGAGVLAVAGGLYLADRPGAVAPNVAKSDKPVAAQPAAPVKVEPPTAAGGVPPVLSAGNLVKKQPGRTITADANRPSQIRESTTELRASPSELASFGESAATLSQTERAVPSRGLTNNAEVDVALRANLRTLNEFIAECEARMKENPRDQLTQEYLNMALQQKAELLNAMMESGRSKH